jgi:hypothetical protein
MSDEQPAAPSEGVEGGEGGAEREGGAEGDEDREIRRDRPPSKLDKSKQLVALIAGVLALLHTLFFGLGLLTHVSREQLLGLSVPLTYPTQSALLTSLNVLWSTPIHSLWTLFAGEPWAFAVFLPLLPLGLALRGGTPTRRAVAAHLVSLLLLIAAIHLYQAALFPRLQPGAIVPHFVTDVGRAWTSRAEQQVIAWLTVEHPGYPGHLKVLAGFAGWLLGISAFATWRVLRRKSLTRPWRWTLAALHLLVGLALLGLVPRAYTVAAWGLSYPRVHLSAAANCDDVRSQALQPRCCVFDISAGGAPRTTLQIGDGCPGGEGFHTWSDDDARCFLLGAREPIRPGCS